MDAQKSLKKLIRKEVFHNPTFSNKEKGVMICKRSYFYHHGMSAEKFCQAITNRMDELGIKYQVVGAYDRWHAWPKNSWFEVRLFVPGLLLTDESA